LEAIPRTRSIDKLQKTDVLGTSHVSNTGSTAVWSAQLIQEKYQEKSPVTREHAIKIRLRN
jgi:hypothetical protein